MASIPTILDNITSPPSNIEKIKNKVAIFYKRTIYILSLAALTAFFPITSGIVGVKIFFHPKIKERTVLARLRAAISIAMIPIPLIGPALYYIMGDDTSKHKEKFSAYLLSSIPFVSSLQTGLALLDE